MNYRAINFLEKYRKFDQLWSPRVIAKMNNYEFKLVRLEGEFIWHQHTNTDEVFIVLEGRLTIEFRDGEVNLNEGEMFVVPKGVEHKPRAEQLCKALIIEPENVVNTGDEESELTAKNNIWI